MAGRYRTFTISNFAGLNEDENPDAIAENELSAAINVWKHGHALGTRPGLERDGEFDAAIASGKAIHGLYEFRSGYDTNRDLVALCGGVVHTSDTATVGNGAGVTISDPGAGTANAGKNLWTFATHKNLLYAAGGAASDTPWSWDGSAGTNTEVVFQNSSAAQIDSKYIFEKYNYLFMTGMNGTAVEDNPTVVRYSAINDGTTWPVGNTFGGTSAIGGIGSYGDEFATGLAEYTDNRGDWLLFLTNRQIYPITFTGLGMIPFRVETGLVVANGCVSQHAYVPLGIDSGDAIYISQFGVHSLRQSQQFGSVAKSFLSWKIRPTIARINRLRIGQSVGAYWPEEGIVVFGVPTGASTHNNVLLVLDLKETPEVTAGNAQWYVWELTGTFNANVISVVRDPADSKRYLYIGDTAGNVLRFNRNVFADLTTGYQARFVTKHNDYGAPGVTKGVGDLWVGLQPGGNYETSMRFIFDYGRRSSSVRHMNMPTSNPQWNEVKWDEVSWGSEATTHRDKVFGTGAGDTIAMEFTHSVADEPFRVTMTALQVRGAGETAGTEAA